MEKMVYEKPEIKMVNVRNEEFVAAPCWSGSDTASGGGLWYYNTSGDGYVSFEMTGYASDGTKLAGGNGCAGSVATNVLFYANDGDTKSDGAASATQITELNKTLEAAAGKDGTPWKGAQNGLTPTDPSDKWS